MDDAEAYEKYQREEEPVVAEQKVILFFFFFMVFYIEMKRKCYKITAFFCFGL